MLSFNMTSIVNLIGFTAFMITLYYMLYKPYFEMTDKRRAEIEKNLNEAEKLRIDAQEKKKLSEEELLKVREQRESLIKNAEMEAKKIVESAKEIAEKEKGNIIKKAEMEANEIKEKAMKEMQSKVVSLSIAISGMILKEQLDKQANQKMVQRAIDLFEKRGENL
ncbi:hypothetical protein OSSY52_21730 [Tepiditoga spiralis]|uniref:ATP synthase subunit b n=1 Tax=Tepiditoga spiralis TaxID=2108365 RepID=A0A7G1GBW3_9BACT|nr:F0F1 ATP synthase subunit B [Tepiditoga spiralis]BBE32032.1 hypothetical protein OSSY52_21730 [Tepiditoga spiralis]